MPELQYVASAIGFDAVEAGLRKQAATLTQVAVAFEKMVGPVNQTKVSLTGLTLQSQEATYSIDNLGKYANISSARILQLKQAEIDAANQARVVSIQTEVAAKEVANLGVQSEIAAVQVKSKLSTALNNLTSADSLAATAVGRIRRQIIGLGLAGIIGTAIPFVIELAESFFTAAKAIDTVKRSAADLAEIQEQGNKSAGKELADLKILYEGTQNLTISTKERTKAAKDLQDLYPDIFKNFSIEDILLGKVSAGYDTLTAAILKKALAQAAQGKLGELGTEELNTQLEFVKKGTAALQDQRKAIDGYQKTLKSFEGDNRPIAKSIISDTKFAQELTGNLTQEKISKALSDFKAKITDIRQRQQNIINAVGADNLIDAVVGAPDKTLKAKKAVETISDVLNKLTRDLGLVNAEQKALGINADDYKKKIDLIEGAIKHLVDKFKIPADGTIIQKLLGDINTIRIEETIRRIKIAAKNELIGAPFGTVDIPVKLVLTKGNLENSGALPGIIAGTFGKDGVNIPIGLSGIPNPTDEVNARKIGFLLRAGVTEGFQDASKVDIEGLRTPELDSLVDKTKKQLEEFKALIIDQFTGIGDSIGDALSGSFKNVGDFFGNLFSSLLSSLGKGLRQLGIETVAASKLILLIKKGFGGATGLGAGIGLIALGTLITTLAAKFSKAPAFASGVTNFGGGLALVGEKGPELVTLPAGSSVSPHGTFGSVQATQQSVDINGHWDLRGQDLLYVIDRATMRRSQVG